jgi:hypothetical protein
MTDVGLTPSEEARVQQAADEAFEVLTGNVVPPKQPRSGVARVLREAVLEAPLQAITVAFLLGVLVARRR